MNTIELLKTDHRKAEKLFDRILKPRSKRKTKRKLFDKLKDALTLHSKTEEKFIYPLMEKKPESHDLTMEANEEHHMIKILLTEIPMTMDNDVWDAKITTLYEQFKHYIKEEEHELFPMFQKHVGKTELHGHRRPGKNMAQ